MQRAIENTVLLLLASILVLVIWVLLYHPEWIARALSH